jgi:protein-S-isoprenylcysteine O-methyltransferase Ste14
MSRSSALLASLLFLFVAPGTVAGLGPWWINGWRLHEGPLAVRVAGAAMIAGGLYLLIECFGRFAVQGRDTPAPIAPPQRLVVSGPYRRVRNPMYVAVVAIILGQAALFEDLRLVAYGAAIWLAFHLFVLFYEEPTLRRTHPRDYAAFAAAVPRWRPRIRPWRAGEA